MWRSPLTMQFAPFCIFEAHKFSLCDCAYLVCHISHVSHKVEWTTVEWHTSKWQKELGSGAQLKENLIRFLEKFILRVSMRCAITSWPFNWAAPFFLFICHSSWSGIKINAINSDSILHATIKKASGKLFDP